ncbi:MAG: glycosyltransferase [Rhodospirillaceae bacterium]
MRILAVSYMVPPMLYPQAIQIGRLLIGTPGELALVSGQVRELGTGLDVYPNFEKRPVLHVSASAKPALTGLADRLGRYFLPFYGRSPDGFRSWVPRAETAALTALAGAGFSPDVMVTFGEPMSDHLLGLRLKSRLGVPWVAHFSDPWADNPFRRHEVFANILNRKLERQVVAMADRVIFTSEETRALVMGKYPEPWRAKTDVLPHSFDRPLYPERRAPSSETLVVRYLGSFYGHRTPKPLFRALRLILDREPELLRGVTFELVGGMPSRMKLDPVFRGLPETLVRLVGTVPYSASLTLMSESDLLLVIDGPDTLSVFLPSKLIDYIGAGVPIFGIVPPGTSARLVERLGGGIADPRDPAGIADGLVRALDLARQRRAAATESPWGEGAVRDDFTLERVVSKFVAILDQARAREETAA